MYSIYHFFAQLYRDRNRLEWVPKLEKFPFDPELISYTGKGKFPDLAIRLNPAGDPSGGELIEVKDSVSYSVPSFNSTIPTGNKSIESLTKGKRSVIREQMESAGDDVYSLPWREVYYLLRGKEKKTGHTKICLVHGSFFETVTVEELIQQGFGQVLEERLEEEDQIISSELHELMLRIFSHQDSFSKVRHVDNASVKIRFRIMTEAQKEGNILNPKIYPEVKDNSLNFVIPQHSAEDITVRKGHLRRALSRSELAIGEESLIKHPFNGDFFLLSFSL